MENVINNQLMEDVSVVLTELMNSQFPQRTVTND